MIRLPKAKTAIAHAAADFAWTRPFIHHLGPLAALLDSAFTQCEAILQTMSAVKGHMTIFVHANGSMSSNQSGGRHPSHPHRGRSRGLHGGFLPGQLFYSTQIPVSL